MRIGVSYALVEQLLMAADGPVVGHGIDSRIAAAALTIARHIAGSARPPTTSSQISARS